MTFSEIILVIGFTLLFISAISVCALLVIAIKKPEENSDDINIGTLWGLFLFGLSMGMLLLWISL